MSGELDVFGAAFVVEFLAIILYIGKQNNGSIALLAVDATRLEFNTGRVGERSTTLDPCIAVTLEFIPRGV